MWGGARGSARPWVFDPLFLANEGKVALFCLMTGATICGR